MKLFTFLIVLIIGIASCIYSVFFGKIHHSLDYDNEKHIPRFFLFFFLFLSLSVGFAFLPVTIWPLPVMALLMALYSNQVTGVLAAGLFTTIATMASGQDVYTFALYLCVCVVTVLIFHGIDESVKLVIPIFIDLSAIAVVELALFFLSEQMLMSDFLIYALVNIILCGLLEIIALKIFCTTVIFKSRDRYLVINDTEYPIMKEAKEKDKSVYMHAVHTAYLSDKIANELHINSQKIKTASYYSRIGEAFEGDHDYEYYEKMCNKHNFPKEAKVLLLECVDKKPIHSKEACIISFSDAMISSVVYMFKRDLNVKPDYESIVNRLLEKSIKEHELDYCDISVNDLRIIQNTLLKETLYYDFLR